jgi:predicted transcriptional regulator of viral defense system
MRNPLTDRLTKLANQQSVIRPRDLKKLGIPRNYLGRLVRAGKLEKVARGLYSSPEVQATAHRTLLEVSRKVPEAVICLSSALRFHELTTESPFQVWIALKRGAWTPRGDCPSIRVVRLSGQSLTFGIEEHSVECGRIKVYDPAKTVADCFKFRSTVGTELALQALRECLREKKATMDEIWTAAKICRVANVMRPYMEALS